MVIARSCGQFLVVELVNCIAADLHVFVTLTGLKIVRGTVQKFVRDPVLNRICGADEQVCMTQYCSKLVHLMICICILDPAVPVIGCGVDLLDCSSHERAALI